MRSFLLVILGVMLFTSCAQTQGSDSKAKEQSLKIPEGTKQKPPAEKLWPHLPKDAFGIQKLFFKAWKE